VMLQEQQDLVQKEGVHTLAAPPSRGEADVKTTLTSTTTATAATTTSTTPATTATAEAATTATTAAPAEAPARATAAEEAGGPEEGKSRSEQESASQLSNNPHQEDLPQEAGQTCVDEAEKKTSTSNKDGCEAGEEKKPTATEKDGSDILPTSAGDPNQKPLSVEEAREAARRQA